MYTPARARAGRPLLAAVLLILLPGLALGYFGFRALAEKETSLRTNYTATIVLVRDRLVAELTRLESELAGDLARPAAGFDDPAATSAWLETLNVERPWLAEPFVLRVDGGVMTRALRAGWSRAAIDPLAALPRLAAAIRDAEAAEFVHGDLDLALRQYRQALTLASSAPARGLVLTRAGRTLFKLRRFDEAVAQYRAVLTLPPESLDRNGLPYVVIALMQIADGFEALGRADEQARSLRQLLDYVVDHAWDVEGGYGYYVARVLASATQPDPTILARARTLTRAVATVEWIRREIRPRIEPDLRSGSWSGPAARRLVVGRDAQSMLIGYRPLPAAPGHAVSMVLGYEVRPEYVVGPMLADVLRTVDLGHDLLVAVLDEQNRPQSQPPTASRPVALVQADLQALLPGWKVGLFHRQGRSIEQLVARERWNYGTLIVGMIVVLIAGVVFTMRASAREAELSRLKTEFVSSVSHELKTPLALIRMFGETLESGIVTDEPKRQEFYAIIRRESERLTHLINNVLDVGRIDVGTTPYAFTRCDVVQLTREALDAYRPFFDRLGFQLNAILPECPLYLRLDRDAIAQALVNLFHNAIKYSGAVKVVAVSVGVRDGTVRLSVADRGIGIPREEIPRIFDKYYRVRTKGTAGSPGSGLGLSIVKHAMDVHRGRVEVESTVEQGSVFTLVLPIGDAASPATAHVPADESPVQPG